MGYFLFFTPLIIGSFFSGVNSLAYNLVYGLILIGIILVFQCKRKDYSNSISITKATKYAFGTLICAVFFISSILFISKQDNRYYTLLTAMSAQTVIKYLLTSIHEEFVFRLYLFNGLKKLLQKDTNAILLSSVSFSLIHIWNTEPKYLMLLIAFSLFFGIIVNVIYVKSKTLFYSILIHFVWNMTSSSFLPSIDLDSSESFAVLLIIILMALVILRFFKHTFFSSAKIIS